LGHGVDHTDNKLSTHTVYLVVSEPSEVGASELPGRHVWAISSRDCFQWECLGTVSLKLFWQWERHLNQFQVNCTTPQLQKNRLTQIFLPTAL